MNDHKFIHTKARLVSFLGKRGWSFAREQYILKGVLIFDYVAFTSDQKILLARYNKKHVPNWSKMARTFRYYRKGN